MTKIDLFRLIIKIFALYFIIQTLFTTLPQSYIFVMGAFDLSGLIILVSTLAIIFFILYILIVKTDWIISVLRLDKGYDSDQIDLTRISNLTILKFSIIFLGGIFIIRNFIPLLTNLGLIFRSMLIPDIEAMQKTFLPEVDYVALIINIINVIIGYLILTNVQRVSNWLNRYENNKSET